MCAAEQIQSDPLAFKNKPGSDFLLSPAKKPAKAQPHLEKRVSNSAYDSFTPDYDPVFRTDAKSKTAHYVDPDEAVGPVTPLRESCEHAAPRETSSSPLVAPLYENAFTAKSMLTENSISGLALQPLLDTNGAKTARSKSPSVKQRLPDSAVVVGKKNRSLSSWFLSHTTDTIILTALLVISLVTRLYALTRSSNVVWDEAHFGKFASYYIRRKFYFDVHPPLGKMLLGLSGFAVGYNGTFEWEAGSKIPSDIRYGGMRAFCGVWGALLAPIAFRTCRTLGLSQLASLVAASLVLFDNGLAVISRFVLLDSMLLCFSALTFCAWTYFLKNDALKKFSQSWWMSLALLGFLLGCVASIKWVGLFTVAVVGLHTIENLWDLWGDRSVSYKEYAKHWGARILCLICLPLAVYVFFFKIHFMILSKSGTGDSQMSSLFQAGLEGSPLHSFPLEVAYGSKITLRGNGLGGGLLHSHSHAYPHGSKQQQVTVYHHRDANNDFIILGRRHADGSYVPVEIPDFTKDSSSSTEHSTPITYIRNGSIVRLLHATTGRNLHSHKVAAPLSKQRYEVSGYGNITLGDLNDNWIVIVDHDARRGSASNVNRIEVLQTYFRLRHEVTGCYLRSDPKSLPSWGFKQHEVSCDPNNKGTFSVPSAGKSKNTLWNIEQHWNPRLPKVEHVPAKSSFWTDFVHLNAAMWSTNNALVPDLDKEPDQLTSNPHEWPLLWRTIRMCSWGDSDLKFLMFGNPIVWWLVAGSVVAFLAYGAGRAVLEKRNLVPPVVEHRRKVFWFTGRWLLLAWVMHYFPFFLMGRVLYLHHYLPALYFGCLHAAFILDHFVALAPRNAQKVVFVGITVILACTFYYFSPLTMGFKTPSGELAESRQWVESWNIGDPNTRRETMAAETTSSTLSDAPTEKSDNAIMDL